MCTGVAQRSLWSLGHRQRRLLSPDLIIALYLELRSVCRDIRPAGLPSIRTASLSGAFRDGLRLRFSGGARDSIGVFLGSNGVIVKEARA